MKFHDDIAVLNNTTGAFRCGEEIEAGTYKVSVEGKHKNAEIFFQVEMNTENKWEAVDNVQVKNKKSAILKIQGNEYLDIINFYPEYGDFKIYIKKLNKFVKRIKGIVYISTNYKTIERRRLNIINGKNIREMLGYSFFLKFS